MRTASDGEGSRTPEPPLSMQRARSRFNEVEQMTIERGHAVMVIPEDGCSTMNADWHRASIEYVMQNVALVTKVDAVIAGFG